MHASLPGFSTPQSMITLLSSLIRRCGAFWNGLLGLRRRLGYRPERSYMRRDR